MQRIATIVTLAILMSVRVSTAHAAFETVAREAMLVDASTGTVLLEKNADQRMPPASMSKLMTIYMAFDALKEGRLKLTDRLPVSERAWKMGGSKMYVLVNDQIAVEDLLRGIIVQSGNDACVVIAENLSGSEEAFAEDMTRIGKEIGLKDSTFRNSSGWPDPNHLMSARDLARLSFRLITDFPEYYPYFSELEFTWAKIRQVNRNPLLYVDIGADGLKTGHTEAAGYGLTASAVQDGRRMILVLNGMTSPSQRSREARRVLQWGFREFARVELFGKDETVDRVRVWSGAESEVPVKLEGPLAISIPRAARDSLKVAIVYEGPRPAPISEGEEMATLRITAEGLPPSEHRLIAAKSVARAGLLGRMKAGVLFLWRTATES